MLVTAEKLFEFVDNTILKVIMNDDVNFSVIPRLHYLSLYCMEIIKLQGDIDKHFFEHALLISYYMAFCATETIKDHHTFCKIVVASTISDLTLPKSKYWLFVGQDPDLFSKYQSSNRHDIYVIRYQKN